MQISLPVARPSNDRTPPRPVDVGLLEHEQLLDMLENYA
jgi:hypothetical protein